MLVAYIAGPYRSDTFRGMVDNVNAAKEVLKQLLQAGFSVVCPHTNTGYLGGIVPEETFLAVDLEILSRCDLLVTVDGWAASVGAVGEVKFAQARGIPVRHCVRDAIAWLKEQRNG